LAGFSEPANRDNLFQDMLKTKQYYA